MEDVPADQHQNCPVHELSELHLALAAEIELVVLRHIPWRHLVPEGRSVN